MNTDIILTGPPRSGTTLACVLLNNIPDTIALHEPMNLKMFPDISSGIEAVRSFFPEMRQSLLLHKKALSKIAGGLIPSNPFSDERSSGRPSIVEKGYVYFNKPLSPKFKLILKHNGHFTFLLPGLQEYFPVFVLLRNPVATIASWNTVNAPVSEGNLRVLKTLNPNMYHSLANEPDLLSRQVQLLNSMYESYLSATKVTYIRYEELISSSGNILSLITGAPVDMTESLENKNRNPLYDTKLIDQIKMKLLQFKGAYIDFYPLNSIENFT